MSGKKVILKIAISSGKFVSHRGAAVEEFREDFVAGNGWRCIYFPDGSIRCRAYIGTDPAGENSISFKISKFGYVCFSKTIKGVKRELRTFKLKKWPTEGIIGLTDGDINERYAYFQDKEYQQFLVDQKIYAVKKEDPNHTYTLYKCFSEEEKKNVLETISTDGKIQEVGKNYGRTSEWEVKHPETFSFEEYQLIRIYGATWVIITEQNFDEDTTKRRLYTLKDLSDLQDLPKISD